MAYVDRTAARRLAPTPAAFVSGRGGCPIGVSAAGAEEVHLPAWPLRSNMLLVAKTGKGKSTLLERLATWQATRAEMAVMIFDPHGDLAFGALGALAAAGVREPVYVDFADTERPVGLNLLDAYAGRSRDKTVANVIDIFSRVWERFWGARMEDCLRFCLLALYEVNTKLPPDRQYGVLHVKRLLLDEPFRRAVLPLVDDFETKEWWRKDFASMPRNFAAEVTKPVITKLNRFAGTEAARNILSQPRTTLDLRHIVRERKPLLVNTAAGLLGPGTSSLLGATLLDLLGLVMLEQAKVAREHRNEAWVAIDEFSAYAAVDWGALLGQLRKFGGHFALATQSLADLDSVDRNLRDRVFANVDTLAVFQTSAADARYLKRELDDAVDEQDLTNLPPHALYLKTAGPDGRAPTCLVQPHPPIVGDSADGLAAARRSARQYGRLVADVERMRKIVGKQHHAWASPGHAGGEGESEQQELSTVGGSDGSGAATQDTELCEIQQEMDL